MPLYIVRKSDGVIFGYSEQLAKNADKHEVVDMKKLPSSGRFDLKAYYRKRAAEEAKKTKKAKAELEKLTKGASDNSNK